jgi:hypothetical protein
MTVETVRVEYDLDRAVREIRDSDLPNEFTEYLRTGGRPVVANSPHSP